MSTGPPFSIQGPRKSGLRSPSSMPPCARKDGPRSPQFAGGPHLAFSVNMSTRKQVAGGVVLLVVAQLAMLVGCSSEREPADGTGGVAGSSSRETGGSAHTTGGARSGGSGGNPSCEWECPGCGCLVAPFTSCAEMCSEGQSGGQGGTHPTCDWECPGCGCLVPPFTSCTAFCDSLNMGGFGGLGGFRG